MVKLGTPAQMFNIDPEREKELIDQMSQSLEGESVELGAEIVAIWAEVADLTVRETLWAGFVLNNILREPEGKAHGKS